MSTNKKTTAGQKAEKYDNCSENGNDTAKDTSPRQPENAPETDSGQGAPGIQGQYPGNNDQGLYPKPGTAPDRPDKDAMNRTGSSHVALGSRDVDADKRRSK